MSETLFRQAFDEVAADVEDLAESERAQRWSVLERLRRPDRVIHFTVRWIDDEGSVRNNDAWRVQHTNLLGPYKGGLRFQSGLELDALRFLAFEQSLKNALTGLPLGAAKGGADFDPGEHSELEVLRFCHAFVDEYVRYLGVHEDVPAGDIGVGAREIGFLFGRYLKLTGRHDGALTGKPESLRGIAGRSEATGFGLVRFAQRVLAEHDDELEGKRVVVSGAGNVALHAAERAADLGAKVLTLSSRSGVARFESGLTVDTVESIRSARSEGRSLREAIEDVDGAEFSEDEKPWSVAADLALPCATQNEVDADAARELADGGVRFLLEGANMPCTAEAVSALREADVTRVPGKAANAGGVAVSGFEISQNTHGLPWDREQTLQRLDDLMDQIHDRCAEAGRRDGEVDYARGANRAGFQRLLDAMVASGVG